jgi:hypothetical protein
VEQVCSCDVCALDTSDGTQKCVASLSLKSLSTQFVLNVVRPLPQNMENRCVGKCVLLFTTPKKERADFAVAVKMGSFSYDHGMFRVNRKITPIHYEARIYQFHATGE